jgi:hypothetical protein
MIAYVPVPKVPGDGGLPKDSNESEIHIFKGYFCKFMCQKEHDNFYEHQIFDNDEFKTYAGAIYNKETEEDFLEKIFDSDAEYQKMTRFVIGDLVNKGLLDKKVKPDGTVLEYQKTSKLKAICPEILGVGLPSIDYLVEKYDKEESKK